MNYSQGFAQIVINVKEYHTREELRLFFTDTESLAELLKAIHKKIRVSPHRMVHLNAAKNGFEVFYSPASSSATMQTDLNFSKTACETALRSSTPQRCKPTRTNNWQELPCIKRRAGAPAPERHEGMAAPSFRLCGLYAEKLLAWGLGASADSAAIIFLPVVVYLLTI